MPRGDNLKGPGQTRKAGPGRPKGSQNRVTVNIKEAALAALEAKGGAKWFQKLADEQPSAFAQLLSRILPHCMADHTGEGPPRLTITWQTGPAEEPGPD